MTDIYELIVYFRHNFLQLIDLLRSTNTGYYVFALCIHQELAHQMLLTSCGITGKCNTGTGCLTHVTKCHHLYINCGTPGIRDIVVTTIYICTRVVPGTENCLDSLHQLFLRVGREICTDLLFVFCLKLFCQFLQILCSQLNVLCNALCCLHLVDQLFKILLADFHNNVREHLDKSAVAIPCPTGITGLLCQNFYYFFI